MPSPMTGVAGKKQKGRPKKKIPHKEAAAKLSPRKTRARASGGFELVVKEDGRVLARDTPGGPLEDLAGV
jgi:hypothetical protein